MTNEMTDTGKPMCCAPGDLSACSIITAADRELADLKANLPKEKQTALGLYVTAKQAYEQWKCAPDKIKIIDVRALEEYLFVGSPEMAWKIPVAAQVYVWDAEKQEYPLKPLMDFVARVQTIAKPEDTLMVMCRSGVRSAIAADFLAKAGFTNVHNIVDGMEGDGNENSESTPNGGWKNTGCPWTKKLTPERMVLP